MARNLKITLAYDGFDFHGWQVQPGLVTVQGLLSAALERVTGERMLPQGSGRTDAGVHALAQVASCAVESPIPVPNLAIALNDTLPAAVRVLAIEEAGADFHARASAQAKTYRYRIWRAAICPPFLARYVYHHPYPLDERAMAAAASVIIGRHDFTSFAAVDPERGRAEEEPSNLRTVFFSPGSAKVRRWSTPCAATAFCTTWCATWWAPSCWWARERCGRKTWVESCRRKTAPRPGRLRPPTGSTWLAWSTEDGLAPASGFKFRVSKSHAGNLEPRLETV